MTASPTVRLVRTGGFANIPMVIEVPVDELPPEIRAALADLPAPTRTKGLAVARAGRADSFTYELVVPVKGRQRVYRFGEATTPAGLTPLVDHLSPALAPEARPK